MLHIHRSERADGLVEGLGDLLLRPLGDPFAPEVVAVATRGMERWLTQRLSARLGAGPARGDGVCANIEFPFPRRLVGDAVAAASGIDPDSDPWLSERSVWPLLEVFDAYMHEPWLAALAAHLGVSERDRAAGDDDTGSGRRFAGAAHVAALFERYGLHRPQMVRAWAAGDTHDGDGRKLPADAVWQAELWRRLRQRIAQPSPAERLDLACARLSEEPDLLALPERVALFGLTRMPAGYLHVLRALAIRRDVHAFLLHPSPALWSGVGELLQKRSAPIVHRGEDPTAAMACNPLLASWGHDVRELQLVMWAPGDDASDEYRPVKHVGATLLARIQADVRADRPPAGAPIALTTGQADERPLLQRGDLSIQVHACHGRARQVEVVREAILHLLAEDPTLEPRDVIVMCPDIETFAPLIAATFGAGETRADDDEPDLLPADVRPTDLRVRLADRSLRQTNPLLDVAAQLLDLTTMRLTASQVLDLADRQPVRRRFRFDDDDLARAQEWVRASGIRWGLDAADRAPFKLEAIAAGTWRAGLDRILLGVTMTEERQGLFADVLPLDDVDSGAIDLVGRLAELVDRLQASLHALTTTMTIDRWAAAIADAVDALAVCSQRDAWQRAELQRVLDEAVREATVAGAVSPASIGLPEIRALLAGRLQGRPTRANFRTGHLTICTLVPMRSVPHRVVCLLGLDDGVFPRKGPRDGDDLMLDDPRVGERDPRSEDRQLLLDALLAATDRLIVTYTGNDERTNIARPPAVPVGELLDVIDATVRVEQGVARDRVVVRHPLQPFDPRNFTLGALVPDSTWSFDAVTLAGARVLRETRPKGRPFLSNPLPAIDDDIVEIAELVRFVQHPVRAFLRRRLNVSVRDFSEQLQDELSVEADPLERWAVGARLLRARLAGVEMRAAIKAEVARGTLPPGMLGRPVIAEVGPVVEEIVSAARGLRPVSGSSHESDSLDVRFELPGGRRLSGTVAGVVDDVLTTVIYSRVGPQHRLAAWVALLALTAAHPQRPFAAATIGRRPRGRGVAVMRLGPLAPDAAERHAIALQQLAVLTDLYDRGMREPLPLYCATSAAYAAGGDDPAAAARQAWKSEWNFDKEDKDREHVLVLEGVRTFDELLLAPPGRDEQGNGWSEGDSSRFGLYAHRLWDRLLAYEQVASH